MRANARRKGGYHPRTEAPRRLTARALIRPRHLLQSFKKEKAGQVGGWGDCLPGRVPLRPREGRPRRKINPTRRHCGGWARSRGLQAQRPACILVPQPSIFFSTVCRGWSRSRGPSPHGPGTAPPFEFQPAGAPLMICCSARRGCAGRAKSHWRAPMQSACRPRPGQTRPQTFRPPFQQAWRPA
jgi:hypothetical protein